MIRGYARVSTKDQDLGRQVADLKKYGCEKIYQEKLSGKLKSRPELDLMLSELGPGDVVVIHKLDRLGRSLQHLLSLVNGFKERGVDFISLNDNFNTTTSQGKLIFNIMGSIAEFERDLISDRTISGLKYLKDMGVKLGRPDKSKDAIIRGMVSDLSREGMSVINIAKKCDISRPVVYKILKSALEY